ncbi:hypothetical protein IAD21_03281 [Abditibacteriota bacterium]|nr:hypothetical protein IAD21_03281 [Abditibacteriota bacterium]
MRFTLWLVLLLALVGIGLSAEANDSAASGIGGNWRLLSREHKSVQMVREHVVLRQLPGAEFETTANFEFCNHGKAVTITMGFPEMAGGDQAGNLGRLAGFRSWVGGQKVPVKFVTAGKGEDETGLYIKRVHFAARQTRHIRVNYRSRSGSWSSSGTFDLIYDFTGGNWKGKVKESVLDVVLLPGRQYVNSLPTLRTSCGATSIYRKGNLFRFRWIDWQAQREFDFPLHSELSGSLYDRENRNGYYPPSLIILPGHPFVKHGAIHSFTIPDGFLNNGHLWIRARWLNDHLNPLPSDTYNPDGATVWDAKRQRVVIHSTIGKAIILARGATLNSTHWPPNSQRAIWIRAYEERQLFLPAQQIEQMLPLKFTFNQSKQLIECNMDFSGFEARRRAKKSKAKLP